MSLHATDRPDPPPLASARPESAAERAARHDARALLLERTRAALAEARTGEDAPRWFEGRLEAVAASDVAREPRAFDLAFGLAPRRLGRTPLTADAAAREAFRLAADTCLPGWHPAGWRIDEASRVLLLTAAEEHAVPALLTRTLRHADLGEQLALYRALPLLPHDEAVVAAARRGLRSDVRAVFEAIVHDNPWPARHLEESAWNQLVLKALFVGSALAPIRGLDARVNPELATMLIDYARERRAAGRPIASELWRALGPFATRAALAAFLPPEDDGAAPWPKAAAPDALLLAALASRDADLRGLVLARSTRAFALESARRGRTDSLSTGTLAP